MSAAQNPSWHPTSASVLVLAGRGAVGVLPVVLVALAARHVAVSVLGRFASALAIAGACVEFSDFASQRYVPRLLAQGAGDAIEGRLASYNGLRVLALAGSFAIFMAGAAFTAPAHLPLLVIVASTAAWATLSGALYAQALAQGRFGVLGVGPFVSLVFTPAAWGVFQRGWPSLGLSALALSLHVGRAAELAFLVYVLAWPTIRLKLKDLYAEWTASADLFRQGVLSTTNARLVVPLVALGGGSEMAGLFAIGMSLLGFVSLVGVAVAVPAYRQALIGGTPRNVPEAFGKTRGFFLAGLMMSAALVALLMAAAPIVLGQVFQVSRDDALELCRWILAAGLFEAVSLFAGVFYNASHQDRLLTRISVFNLAFGWLIIGLAASTGDVSLLGLGFLLSRAIGAIALYLPMILVGRRAR